MQIFYLTFTPQMVRTRKLESSQIATFLKFELLLEFDLRTELSLGNTELRGNAREFLHLSPYLVNKYTPSISIKKDELTYSR